MHPGEPEAPKDTKGAERPEAETHNSSETAEILTREEPGGLHSRFLPTAPMIHPTPTLVRVLSVERQSSHDFAAILHNS